MALQKLRILWDARRGETRDERRGGATTEQRGGATEQKGATATDKPGEGGGHRNDGASLRVVVVVVAQLTASGNWELMSSTAILFLSIVPVSVSHAKALLLERECPV